MTGLTNWKPRFLMAFKIVSDRGAFAGVVLAHQPGIGYHRWRGPGPPAYGTTDFSVLQNKLRGRSTKIVMVALDLFYSQRLRFRKVSTAGGAQGAVQGAHRGHYIQCSENFEVNGRETFKHACSAGW